MNTLDAAVHPLGRRALYQDVADRLRQQIFARRLEPGSWIDELKLAAEFGISRTPLREALKVLAAEGLVTMRPPRTSTRPTAITRRAFSMATRTTAPSAASSTSCCTPTACWLAP